MLILCTMCLTSVSCRSVESVQEFLSRQSLERVFAYANGQEFRSVDTVLLHDSVFIQERTKGDTVYLTRTEWRDRWRIREVHDTIRDTQYITQTIEHPPEKYVPKFYKWCTGLLWAIGLLTIGYWLLKWWLKCRV